MPIINVTVNNKIASYPRDGEVLYRSTLDNNVYTPAQYAPNWELV